MSRANISCCPQKGPFHRPHQIDVISPGASSMSVLHRDILDSSSSNASIKGAGLRITSRQHISDAVSPEWISIRTSALAEFRERLPASISDLTHHPDARQICSSPALLEILNSCSGNPRKDQADRRTVRRPCPKWTAASIPAASPHPRGGTRAR